MVGLVVLLCFAGIFGALGVVLGRRGGWTRALLLPWVLSGLAGLSAAGYAVFVESTCTEVCGPTVLGLLALVLLGVAVALTVGWAVGARRRP